MFDRNNSLEKNRRTLSVFVVVLVLWCISTLLVCYVFVLYLHIKFSEDLVLKTAANMQNFEESIKNNVQSIINEEIKKMKSETWASLAVSNENPTWHKLVSPSTSERTIEDTSADKIILSDDDNNVEEDYHTAVKSTKEKRFLEMYYTKSAKPIFTSEHRLESSVIRVEIDEKAPTTDDKTTLRDILSQPRISKRDAELYSSNMPMSTTNSIGISNQFLRVNNHEHNQEEDQENRTSTKQNLRSSRTSSKHDAVEIAGRQVTDVPTKSKKNGVRSKAKVIDIVDEDECVSVESQEHDSSQAHLKSSKLKNDEKKSFTSSKLVEETGCPEADVVVAAHFGADSSSFKSQKQYYKQNDLVRHPTGEYRQWKFDKWHHDFQMFQYVNLTNGRIIIQKAGLYFVYAQMYFTEWADINAFVISKNDEPVLQCVTSYYGDRTKEELSNTCFTGGLVLCKKRDELSVRGVHPGRSVVLEATKSFFGMFKLREGSWQETKIKFTQQ